MRTCINRLAITFFLAALPAVLAAQELTLPRQELNDAIKAANDARIQELTAALKAAQKSIAGGAKGSGVSRRDAIIAARKRESEIEAELAKIRKTPPMVELDIAKLAVGQIGRLYRNQAASSPMTLPSDNGPGGTVRFMTTTVYRVSVSGRVTQIIDGQLALVSVDDNKSLLVRMPTRDLATGQTIKLNQPVKVVGTRAIGAATVFELAFFGEGP
jgi:hypothetical protein